ncbi:MAG: acyloxyacyl hydrolase [Desulfobacterales bacterium]
MNQIAKTAFLAILVISAAYHSIYAEENSDGENHNWLYEIRMGILAHDVTLWSRTREEGGVDVNAEFIFGFPGSELLSGVVYSNLGLSLNSRGDTSKAYAGLLWEYMWQSDIFFNLGLGLAVHDGQLDSSDDKKALGSRILFRIPIEFGLLFTERQGVSVMFDHVSNAYLADPNEGLDTIGVRYIYRF